MRQVMRVSAVLWAAGALAGQTGSLPGTLAGNGSISGAVVEARTNRALAGVFVTAKYGGLPPLARTVKSGADGSFQLTGLPAGAYWVCVQVPGGGYLDPCQWVASAPGRPAAGATLALASGQRLSGYLARVQAGSVLRARVNDPGQSLGAKTKEGREPHLLIGVWGPDGSFYPMRRAARDAAGATYLLTVPVDVKLRFAIASRNLKLSDEAGAALPAAGAAVDFQHRSGEANPKSFVFTVTGVLP